MVVIRLARGGAKKRPFYNPVAAAHEEGLRISQDRVAYWTERGAQMSDTVAMLVKRAQTSAQPAAQAAAQPAA